jgi:serine/threonine protein kinase
MDNNSIVIFINDEAIDISNLFLNDDWSLKKVYDRIYSIIVNKVPINWLVKTYEKSKYAMIEARNLNYLKNVKGVPKILASSISNNFSYIIMSYIQGVDLYDHIEEYGIFSEEDAKPIIKQLLTIVKQCHSCKIIHKDIKPENIIYNIEDQSIHLIDFEGKETEGYRSPEQVKGGILSTKTDMYTIGTTLYYMLTKKSNVEKAGITYRQEWSLELIDFLRCLTKDVPTNRINTTEALYHEWLN